LGKSVPQDVYIGQSFDLQKLFEVNAAVRRLPSHIPCAYKHPARSSNTVQLQVYISDKTKGTLKKRSALYCTSCYQAMSLRFAEAGEIS
jgi:hypothetical protein